MLAAQKYRPEYLSIHKCIKEQNTTFQLKDVNLWWAFLKENGNLSDFCVLCKATVLTVCLTTFVSQK